jgi:hypothetical protein
LYPKINSELIGKRQNTDGDQTSKKLSQYGTSLIFIKVIESGIASFNFCQRKQSR